MLLLGVRAQKYQRGHTPAADVSKGATISFSCSPGHRWRGTVANRCYHDLKLVRTQPCHVCVDLRRAATLHSIGLGHQVVATLRFHVEYNVCDWPLLCCLSALVRRRWPSHLQIQRECHHHFIKPISLSELGCWLLC